LKEKFQQDITAFFKIYNVFAKADSLTSVTKIGRSREMVGYFLIYFSDIYSQNDENITKSKTLVLDNLENYLKIHSSVDCLKKYPYEKISVVANKNNNAPLERSFQIFLKASKLYAKHRRVLTNSEIVKIYQRNALEYYVTAFGQDNLNQFKDNLTKFILDKEVNKITILKQALMPYHILIMLLVKAL